MRQKGLKEGHSILHHLSRIAPQMLRLKEQSNLSEFVLHELCCQDGFSLNKAAYLVDNPDFNCLRGIAGYSCHEAYPLVDNGSIWDVPEEFSAHMGKSSFNQAVRSVNQNSVRAIAALSAEGSDAFHAVSTVKEMAQAFGFEQYDMYSWDMKHDNHGILLFEWSDNASVPDEHFKNGVSLLGFCPLF